MQQHYQDVMAIACSFCNINLFITIMTNPKWVEIQQELLPGQTAYDCPDLVACVFNLKKGELLNDITKKHIFGKVFAYVYVIEFQKCRLPHVDILVVLDKNNRLCIPHNIDSCISAQWPDPEKNCQLFDTVKLCMIHGPCGNINSSAPCMIEGKCSKCYPKSYQELTITNNDGYPLYTRPNDGCIYLVKVHNLNRMVEVDNWWIVLYNPNLSSKYNCHINVESVATFKTLKYYFKCIHKGPDCATLQCQLDKIKTYIDGCYISAPEAVWHIFHFVTHEQFPAVAQLQVCCSECHVLQQLIVYLQIHLPGKHMVIFDPDEPVETIIAHASSKVTTLMEFFRMNNTSGPEGDCAQTLTYQEFPQNFVWDKAKKTWSLCKQGFSLGQIYFVSPTAGKRFHLCTLEHMKMSCIQHSKMDVKLMVYLKMMANGVCVFE